MCKVASLLLILTQVCLSHCGYDCIQNCICEVTADDLLSADCSAENFTEVPEPFFKYKLHVLLLQFNQIVKIGDGEFDHFEQLEELNLRGNRLVTIANDAFTGLKRLQKLDLSHNNLVSFSWNSSGLSSLAWLSLAKNFLNIFPAKISGLAKLEFFDVSENRLATDLPTGSLPKSLKKLKLHHTGLRIRSLSELESLEYVDLSGCVWDAPRDAFSNMQNLRTLLLSNSNLTEPPSLSAQFDTSLVITHSAAPVIHGVEASGDTAESTTPSSRKVLWYNPQLSVLDLSGNPRMAMQTGQMNLPPSLVNLNLAGTKVNDIDEEFFEHAQSVKYVDLSYANVTTISPGAFRTFDNLTDLDLSGNPLESLPRLPGTLKKLTVSKTAIRRLSRDPFSSLAAVVEMNISCGRVRTIDDNSFGDMVALERLDLSGNEIDNLTKNSLSIGPLVEHSHVQNRISIIDVSRGFLTGIERGAFRTHKRLKTLNLEWNRLRVILSGTFDGLGSLESLNLRYNSIVDLQPGVFNGMKDLRVLHLEYNRLEVLHKQTLKKLNKLKELHLANNNLRAIHSHSLPALLLLDVANNSLSSLPEVLGENIQSIDASHNSITTLDVAHFRNLGRLENLNLSHCHLHNVQYNLVFRNTVLLRTLDLTGNDIAKFIDVGLPLLKTLLMAENRIGSIHVTLVSILPSIETLDLRNNMLLHMDPSIFEGAQSLKMVDFSGASNFQCDCNLADFVHWVEAHASIVRGAGLYECAEPPEHRGMSVIGTVNGMQCGNDRASESNKTSIYVVLCILVVVLAVLVAIFVRRRCKQARNQTNGSNTCCLYGRLLTRSRERVFSEERRDLVEYMTSPIDKDAPVSL